VLCVLDNDDESGVARIGILGRSPKSFGRLSRIGGSHAGVFFERDSRSIIDGVEYVWPFSGQ
jgi:hypothetical protein